MYVCNSCGFDSAKWYGRCPECQAWSSFAEIKVESTPKGNRPNAVTKEEKVLKVGEIAGSEKIRIPTGFGEYAASLLTVHSATLTFHYSSCLLAVYNKL